MKSRIATVNKPMSAAMRQANLADCFTKEESFAVARMSIAVKYGGYVILLNETGLGK